MVNINFIKLKNKTIMSNKINKWRLINGQLISTNEGVGVQELITNNLKEAASSIINPVVDKLAMQDEALVEAEFANLGKNIDRRRINRFNTYLNQKMDDVAIAALEAGKRIEESQRVIEAEIIDDSIVEVLPFSEVLASKLGGTLAPSAKTNSSSKGLPASEFEEFV
jgi:ABC-type phosphate transport system auxiliary subunit